MYLRPLALNFCRVLVYFLVFSAITLAVYGESPFEVLPYLLENGAHAPNTFLLFPAVILLFTLFALLFGAFSAAKEQNIFQTSLAIRIMLFVMNILPIAVFQHTLLPRIGSSAIWFFISFFALQLLFEIFCKTGFLRAISKLKIVFPLRYRLLAQILAETLIVLLSALIAFFFSGPLSLRHPDFGTPRIAIFYMAYIVLFNSITFFFVEKIISIFQMEYRKHYSRFYFIYEYNTLKRSLHLLRGAMPEVTQTLRKNLTWLFTFLLAVDGIFENINSIGFNLINGYNYDSVIILRNAAYIFALMFVLNTALDYLFLRFSRKNESGAQTRDTHALFGLKDICAWIWRRKMPAALCAGVYVILFALCLYLYPFAGYYDFQVNQTKTLGDFCRYQYIAAAGFPENMPLCTAEGTSYKLLALTIRQDGKTLRIFPFYDTADRAFHWIRGGSNRAKLETLASYSEILKAETVSFPNFLPLIAFRLPSDTSLSLTLKKPLWMCVLFWLFFFAALCLSCAALTCLFYAAGRIPKLLDEVVEFLNTSTLVLVFLLVNMAAQRTLHAVWVNANFLLASVSYLAAQILIMLMFSGNYNPAMRLHKKTVLASNEFTYYKLLGMNAKDLSKIYHQKYGRNMLLSMIFQNILFVFNLNWFIIYALNFWPGFKDSIGLTYEVSLENVFSKIFHGSSFSHTLPFAIALILIDAALFLIYNRGKRLRSVL